MNENGNSNIQQVNYFNSIYKITVMLLLIDKNLKHIDFKNKNWLIYIHKGKKARVSLKSLLNWKRTII